MATDRNLCIGLGRVVRKLRLERGLTQERLSLEVGIHRNYIGDIERTGGNPSISHVNRLANGLDVSVDELVRLAAEYRG